MDLANNSDETGGQPGRKKTWILVGIVLLVIVVGGIFLVQRFGTRILGLLQPTQASISTSANSLEDGYRFLASGHYDRAVSVFDRVIAEGKDLAKAYAGRGDGYAGLRRFDKAVEDYTTSLNYGPTAALLADRCNAFRLLGKLEPAQVDCNAALSLDPQDPDAHIALGLLYLDKKDNSSARAEMETAIRIAPESVEAHYALSQLEMTDEHPDRAIAALSKCIELEPTNPDWYWERGFIYFSTGKSELAIQDMRSVLKYGNPDVNGEVLFKAGTLLKQLGQNP